MTTISGSGNFRPTLEYTVKKPGGLSGGGKGSSMKKGKILLWKNKYSKPNLLPSQRVSPMLVVKVPTINDTPKDFNQMFKLWKEVLAVTVEVPLHDTVRIDFSPCKFLRHNAVAFIGGIAKYLESFDIAVVIDVDTLQNKIRENLERNGFLSTFTSWQPVIEPGNSIPFRFDRIENRDAIVRYLEAAWLGRDWVHVSERLTQAIVGRTWEIFANAFEHSRSPIGVFSCGQRYPQQKELILTVVDFGSGIPFQVRRHLGTREMPVQEAFKWAFQRGNTTSQDKIGRGMGLDLLREFVKANRGRLEVYSNNGYYVLQQGKEEYSTIENAFSGTVVNIMLKCDDKYYVLKQELKDEPLF